MQRRTRTSKEHSQVATVATPPILKFAAAAWHALYDGRGAAICEQVGGHGLSSRLCARRLEVFVLGLPDNLHYNWASRITRWAINVMNPESWGEFESIRARHPNTCYFDILLRHRPAGRAVKCGRDTTPARLTCAGFIQNMRRRRKPLN